MNYSNVQILNELRNIDKCLNLAYSKEEGNENIRNCIYRDSNSGILNYLIEYKFITMSTHADNIIIPSILPYGRDFLKKSRLRCYIEDYAYIVGIIGAIGAIYTILSYFK